MFLNIVKIILKKPKDETKLSCMQILWREGRRSQQKEKEDGKGDPFIK
jgi:hypothetical protein